MSGAWYKTVIGCDREPSMNASSLVRVAFAIALGGGVAASAAQSAPPANDVTVPVTVAVAQPVELTIEWLALSASGQQVLATRKEVVERQLTIQVSPGPDRFVR